jgi:Tol biopolymer transport system component
MRIRSLPSFVHPAPFALLALLACACASLSGAPTPPIPGVERCDELIQPTEQHFAHLWRVTRGGENAEAYWSNAGDRLTLQRRFGDIKCDRIFVTDAKTGALQQISNGRGKTTCSYFLPGDREVLFASTQSYMSDCPPPIDYQKEGYVWAIHPEFDIFVRNLDSGVERTLTSAWGYDAEATVSPVGDRIVFTSDRSGDLELWTCDLDGKDLKQVTNELGYDGGAFFSHDGKQLVFRATRFVDGDPEASRERYAELYKNHRIRPHLLDLCMCDADGSHRRRVTDLGGASWAPYFFPDDKRIIFSSNHHDPRPKKTEFDLFAVDVDGKNLEQITTNVGFDSFPMFSPDGRYLVFASNRGGSEPGETSLYIAQWR